MKKFKRKGLALIIALSMVFTYVPSLVFADASEASIIDSGSCGINATWTLDTEGNLVISGTGELYDYHDKFKPSCWYGATSLVIEDGITYIGRNMFSRCENLTSISIPGSVTTIGGSSFDECGNLTSITIPDGVTCIEKRAFTRFFREASVTIPDSVTYIGEYNFLSNSVTIYGNIGSCAHKYARDTYLDFSCISHQNIVAMNDQPAGCGYTGLTGGKKCDDCHTIIEAQTIVPERGHIYDRREAIEKAGFGKPGTQAEYCKCGDDGRWFELPCPKKIKLSTVSYTYDGKAKKPTVTVYDSKGEKISSYDYTVSYASGCKNVGKYKVTVTFNWDSSRYEGSSYTTFKINPAAKSISKITPSKKAFTVKWSKPSSKYRKQMTGYQIKYSTSSKMSKAKTVTVKSTTATSKKISKLKAKKTYYVQLRTYKTVKGVNYYSSWSKVKKVKTK